MKKITKGSPFFPFWAGSFLLGTFLLAQNPVNPERPPTECWEVVTEPVVPETHQTPNGVAPNGGTNLRPEYRTTIFPFATKGQARKMLVYPDGRRVPTGEVKDIEVQFSPEEYEIEFPCSRLFNTSNWPVHLSRTSSWTWTLEGACPGAAASGEGEQELKHQVNHSGSPTPVGGGNDEAGGDPGGPVSPPEGPSAPPLPPTDDGLGDSPTGCPPLPQPLSPRTDLPTIEMPLMDQEVFHGVTYVAIELQDLAADEEAYVGVANNGTVYLNIIKVQDGSIVTVSEFRRS